MRLPGAVVHRAGAARNFIWRTHMKRFGLLPLALLALAISTVAQGNSSNQPAASAQAQTSANASAAASASASPSQSKQEASPKQNSAQSSASGSASASNSAEASSQAGDASLNLSSDTPIQATLLTAVDAKHSKPGDQVIARTTEDVKQDGHVVLRKGTKLVGHVTEAQARSKSNAESAVGVAFDNAVMKGGQQTPMHLNIQALAAASNQTAASLSNDDAMLASGGSVAGSGRAGGGGGLLRGTGGAVGGATSGAGAVAGNAGQVANGAAGATAHTATSAAGTAAGTTGGLNAAGQLSSDSRGVFGLQGLNLNAAASSATQGSVVTSTSRNVHLDSGTQMVLQVAKQ
jgi:hypothetical protein